MEDDVVTTTACEPKRLQIFFRSVRIGSFKIKPAGPNIPVVMSSDDFRFQTSTLRGVSDVIELVVKTSGMLHIRYHLGESLPIMFISATPAFAEWIRQQLHMTTPGCQYFDPDGQDDREKLIIFKIDVMSEAAMNFIQNGFPGVVMEEIDRKMVDDIRAQFAPKQRRPLTIQEALDMYEEESDEEHAAELSSESPVVAFIVRGYKVTVVRHPWTYDEQTGSQPVQNRLTITVGIETDPILLIPSSDDEDSDDELPPPEIGERMVTEEDMECLEQGKYLNDVIIDFYLKFVKDVKLSEIDRNRTHIFSCSFYISLLDMFNSCPPVGRESGVRVVRLLSLGWTREVDIFEKDFTFIPIRQNDHWFLAIICFPRLFVEAASPAPKNTYNSETVLNDGETSKNPEAGQLDVEMDDMSGKNTNHMSCSADDQSKDDDDSFSDSSDISIAEAPEPIISYSNTHPDCNAHFDKMPCILILDSLEEQDYTEVTTILKEVLQMGWDVKKGIQHNFTGDSVPVHIVSVPKQANDSDGGIYVLQYVESFFFSPIPYFAHKMPDLKDWFTPEKACNKRCEIEQLVLDVWNHQQRELNSTE